MRQVWVVLTMTCALLVAGCGGADVSETEPSTRATTTPTTLGATSPSSSPTDLAASTIPPLASATASEAITLEPSLLVVGPRYVWTWSGSGDVTLIDLEHLASPRQLDLDVAAWRLDPDSFVILNLRTVTTPAVGLTPATTELFWDAIDINSNVLWSVPIPEPSGEDMRMGGEAHVQADVVGTRVIATWTEFDSPGACCQDHLYVVALDVATGAVAWRFDTSFEENQQGEVIAGSGIVAVVTSEGRDQVIRGLETETGSVVYEKRLLGGDGLGSIAVDSDEVTGFLTDIDGSLYGHTQYFVHLDRSGTETWRIPGFDERPVARTPDYELVRLGGLYGGVYLVIAGHAATTEGDLVAIDAVSGNEVWRIAGENIDATLANWLYATDQFLVGAAHDGGVVVDIHTGVVVAASLSILANEYRETTWGWGAGQLVCWDAQQQRLVRLPTPERPDLVTATCAPEYLSP